MPYSDISCSHFLSLNKIENTPLSFSIEGDVVISELFRKSISRKGSDFLLPEGM